MESFGSDHHSTLDAGYLCRELEAADHVKLQIQQWKLAPHPGFNKLTNRFLKGATFIILLSSTKGRPSSSNNT